MIKIKSKRTNKLTKNEIYEIATLKNTFWKYNIKSQIKFLKKNYKKNDIHNLYYIKKNLACYNCLRIRKNSTINFSIFDAFIIKKKNRNKKLSYKVMNYNQKLIKKFKLVSFLICNKKLQSFYKKNGWKKINSNRYKVINSNNKYISMVFNDTNRINKNLLLPIKINLK